MNFLEIEPDVLAVLSTTQTKTIRQIQQETGHPERDVVSALLDLQLKKQAASRPGRLYYKLEAVCPKNGQ